MELDSMIQDIQARKQAIQHCYASAEAEKEGLRAQYKRLETLLSEIRGIAGIVQDDQGLKRPRKGISKKKGGQGKRPKEAIIAASASRAIRKAKEASNTCDQAKRLGMDAALATAKKYGISELGQQIAERIDKAAQKHFGPQQRARS